MSCFYEMDEVVLFKKDHLGEKTVAVFLSHSVRQSCIFLQHLFFENKGLDLNFLGVSMESV